MPTTWTQKSGLELIWSSRVLISDIDPSHFAIDPAVATELYRRAVAELAEELPWPNVLPVTFSVAAGGYQTLSMFPNLLVDGFSEAVWVATPEGQIELVRRPPEELRAQFSADIQLYGAVRTGRPERWAVERDNQTNQMNPYLLLYPSPTVAGKVIAAAGGITTEQDVAATLKVDMGFAQTLELKLGAQFAARLPEDQLARLGLPPTIAQTLEANYQNRLTRERERFGAPRRQARVFMGRP